MNPGGSITGQFPYQQDIRHQVIEMEHKEDVRGNWFMTLCRKPTYL